MKKHNIKDSFQQEAKLVFIFTYVKDLHNANHVVSCFVLYGVLHYIDNFRHFLQHIKIKH